MKKVLISLLIIIVIGACAGIGLYNYMISAPSKDNLVLEFNVERKAHTHQLQSL